METCYHLPPGAAMKIKGAAVAGFESCRNALQLTVNAPVLGDWRLQPEKHPDGLERGWVYLSKAPLFESSSVVLYLGDFGKSLALFGPPFPHL